MTRDRLAGLVPMWTPEDERNLRRRVDRLAARRPQIVLVADDVDDDGSPLEWNAAGMEEAAGRAAYELDR